MCIHCTYTSYCVAQQQPQKPGNLPIKKKVTHIIPPAPGASKVTKLEPGGHFVYRNLFFAAIWSKLFLGGRNHTFWSQSICPKSMEIGMNGVAVARNGLILWENGATGSRKVFKYLRGFWDAI